MTMLNYAIKPVADTVGYMGTCRDLPEFASAGDTIDELLRHSIEGLIVTLDIYISNGIPVPLPSKVERDEHLVELSGMISAKVYLHNALIQSGITKSELARRIGIPNQIINRLFDVTSNSKWEQMERAFDALGKKLIVSVIDKLIIEPT